MIHPLVARGHSSFLQESNQPRFSFSFRFARCNPKNCSTSLAQSDQPAATPAATCWKRHFTPVQFVSVHGRRRRRRRSIEVFQIQINTPNLSSAKKCDLRQRVLKPASINETSPNCQHYATLNHFSWCRSAMAHRATVAGGISGAASQQPLLLPCRVGNGLHSVSDWFKVDIGWLVNAYFNHPIDQGGGVGSMVLAILFTKPTRQAHKAQRGLVMGTKETVSRHEGGWFPGCKVMVCKWNVGWDHGSGHVALLTVTSRALIQLKSSTRTIYVVLVLCNDRRMPSSYLRSSNTGPMDWFKEASDFDFEYSSNING